MTEMTDILINIKMNIKTFKEENLSNFLLEQESKYTGRKIDDLEKEVFANIKNEKIELAETVKCKKCGGNTITKTLQLRAGDEGSTTLVTCLKCNSTYGI